MSRRVDIAASVLSADFGRLAEQVAEAEQGGADRIHFDVMDGQFVPNLTIGAGVCAAVRRATRLPIDVHLMTLSPERLFDSFADAGASSVAFHWEASAHVHRSLAAIRALGMRAGIAINPATPPELLRDLLAETDLVLVMSVNPGFGGQQFIGSSIGKIARLRAIRAGGGATVEIQVDGGIAAETAPAVVAAGAAVLIAGSAVFGGMGSVADNLQQIRRAAESAFSVG